jgi:ATP-binding cassette subfamily B protein
VGEIVTFMGFANHLIGRLNQVVGFTNNLFMQAPSLAQFFDVLDTRSMVLDLPDARPLSEVRGRIEFEMVEFSYTAERKTLENINFVVEPGRTVALVGETGAGKSTVMGLLMRQYDPTSGRILIDGNDLRELTLDSLRANIGVVFQESLLFFRTIEENLRVGRPDATEEEMVEAARQAQAHDFIMRQPKGYKTHIGERGANLSGGERQRLAIARVLLKNPPVLILDEATSALDNATESKVQQAFQNLMRGRTTLIIAHRLTTIRNADEILVFHQGRIIEQGDFNGLVEKGGAFSQLVKSQRAL